MNFYNLDGHVHNSLYESLPSNIENFATAAIDDKDFNCKEKHSINGPIHKNIIPNSTYEQCKQECLNEGPDCVGFDFNNTNNVCSLKEKVHSLNKNNQEHTSCVRKHKKKCSAKKDKNVFSELEHIFKNNKKVMTETESRNTGDSKHPSDSKHMDSKHMDSKHMDSKHMDSKNMGKNVNEERINHKYNDKKPRINHEGDDDKHNWHQHDGKWYHYHDNKWHYRDNDKWYPYEEDKNAYNKLVNAIKTSYEHVEKDKHKHVYIDLKCFMEKMNVLNKHSDNMMIDLSLLTSNLKSCSYVNKEKDKKPTEKSAEKLAEKDTIDIPKPDTVKLLNVPATVLITADSRNPENNNHVVGLSKETFENYDEVEHYRDQEKKKMEMKMK